MRLAEYETAHPRLHDALLSGDARSSIDMYNELFDMRAVFVNTLEKDDPGIAAVQALSSGERTKTWVIAYGMGHVFAVSPANSAEFFTTVQTVHSKRFAFKDWYTYRVR